MSATAPARPGSVTTVVVLTWIVAILTIIGGVALLLLSDDTLSQAGIAKGTATTFGWVEIVLGVVVALVAMGLARGSNGARMLVTILMIVRIVAAVWIAVAVGSSAVWSAVATGILALIILGLLWNAKASAYFASR